MCAGWGCWTRASRTKRLFLSAWSASLAHAWAMLSSSIWCGCRWLRWQSEHRLAHIYDTGTDAQAAPPKPEPEKCPAAMRQNQGGTIVFLAAPARFGILRNEKAALVPSGLFKSNAWLSCADPGELAPEVGCGIRVRTNQVAVMAFQWVTADFRTMTHLYNNSVVANVPCNETPRKKKTPGLTHRGLQVTLANSGSRRGAGDVPAGL